MEASKKAYDDICEVGVLCQPFCFSTLLMFICHTYNVLCCVVCARARQCGMPVVVWVLLHMQEVLEAEDIAAAVLYALGAPARVDVSRV